jgi:transposase
MLKLEWSTEAVEALRSWRFHHPHPLVHLKMEVVLLHSQGIPNEQIQPICGISTATLYRYLHAYQAGGVERLKALHFHRPDSALVHQRTTLEEPLRTQPPATVAAAAAQIDALTGGQTRPNPNAAVLKEVRHEAAQAGTDSGQSRS